MSGKAQKQTVGNECGVFALSYATSLFFGMDSTCQIYEQDRMRDFILLIASKQTNSQFPCRQTDNIRIYSTAQFKLDIHKRVLVVS